MAGGWCEPFSDIDPDSEEIIARRQLAMGSIWKGESHIGSDVLIGRGARIQHGISIGHDAVIADGAVVTKNVRPYAIVAGVPAKEIRRRFPDEIVDRLLSLQWWDYGTSILNGCDFSDIELAVGYMEKRATDLEKKAYPKFRIDPQNNTITRLSRDESTLTRAVFILTPFYGKPVPVFCIKM